jgi:hypothetical protein
MLRWHSILPAIYLANQMGADSRNPRHPRFSLGVVVIIVPPGGQPTIGLENLELAWPS